LVAFKIMPLENMNEFTTHILEIVNAHMILRKNLMVRIRKSWFCLGASWFSLIFCGNCTQAVGLENVKLLGGCSGGVTAVLVSLERGCVAVRFQRFLL